MRWRLLPLAILVLVWLGSGDARAHLAAPEASVAMDQERSDRLPALEQTGQSPLVSAMTWSMMASTGPTYLPGSTASAMPFLPSSLDTVLSDFSASR